MKCGKKSASDMIGFGWKSGLHFLSQLCITGMQNKLVFDTQKKTTLTTKEATTFVFYSFLIKHTFYSSREKIKWDRMLAAWNNGTIGAFAAKQPIKILCK